MLYVLIAVALIGLGVAVLLLIGLGVAFFVLHIQIDDVEDKTNKLVNDQRLLNDRMDWLRAPETPQPKP